MRFPVAYGQAISVHFFSKYNQLCLDLLAVVFHWWYENNFLSLKSEGVSKESVPCRCKT